MPLIDSNCLHSSPATQHVGHILLQPSQLKVLQVAPLAVNFCDDFAIVLLLAKVEALIAAVWVATELLEGCHQGSTADIGVIVCLDHKVWVDVGCDPLQPQMLPLRHGSNVRTAHPQLL